jgi:hypothetical protein
MIRIRATTLLLVASCVLATLGTGRTAAGQVKPASVSTVGSITGLTDPLTRMVVQRRDDNVGLILFAGTYSGNVDSFQASSSLQAGMSGIPLGWTFLIDVSIVDGHFLGGLRQPAGGFYNLQVRPVYRGQPGAVVLISTVGVGEVFITAGQSNTTNWGSPTGFLPNPLVSCFGDGYLAGTDPAYPGSFWRYGVDPQPALDSSNGGSVWPTMASDLAGALNVPIGLYAVGLGGSAISDWLPDYSYILGSPSNPPISLFGRLTNAITYFNERGGVRAILWDQGESDYYDQTSELVYGASLAYIINQSRARTNVPVKWMVAVAATPLTDTLNQRLQIELAQASVVDNFLTFPGPNSDSIGLPFRNYLDGLPVHFNAPGLVLLGGYWAIYIANMPGFLGLGALPAL